MSEDKYAEFISQRIFDVCHKRGDVSLYELSKISGVSMSTIQNIVHCHTKSPGLQTMHRLANGLSMTISEFLDCSSINDYEFSEEENRENGLNDCEIIS